MTDLERAAAGEFPVFRFGRRGIRLHVVRFDSVSTLVTQRWGRIYAVCGRRLPHSRHPIAHRMSRIMPDTVDAVCAKCAGDGVAIEQAILNFWYPQPPSVRYGGIWYLVDNAAGIFAP